MLRRSIESALGQSYANVEVIVSDNASTDNTQTICHEFCEKYEHFKYIRQPLNVGASANFSDVLKRATGEYFMWLGDDDWIDDTYVSHCISIMRDRSDVALACGIPLYYKLGLMAYAGKLFNLTDESSLIRVAKYYAKVTDNGMFYGVMRTSQLQQLFMPNVMGGDWHLLANIVSTGKTVMSPTVAVHRELGGATESYQKIVRSLGLPMAHAVFPMASIAFSAYSNIMFNGSAFKTLSLVNRINLASVVFLITITRPMFYYARRFMCLCQQFISFSKKY
jgi:glycosyltransferase involved in cell wall biosynthesis